MNNKILTKIYVCIKKELNIYFKVQAFCMRNAKHTIKPNPANNIGK